MTPFQQKLHRLYRQHASNLTFKAEDVITKAIAFCYADKFLSFRLMIDKYNVLEPDMDTTREGKVIITWRKKNTSLTAMFDYNHDCFTCVTIDTSYKDPNILLKRNPDDQDSFIPVSKETTEKNLIPHTDMLNFCNRFGSYMLPDNAEGE